MASQAIEILLAVGIVGAFASVQLGWTSPDDPRYLVANLVSSAGLVVFAFLSSQIGFVITNGLWVIVSAAGLVRLALRRRRRRSV